MNSKTVARIVIAVAVVIFIALVGGGAYLRPRTAPQPSVTPPAGPPKITELTPLTSSTLRNALPYGDDAVPFQILRAGVSALQATVAALQYSSSTAVVPSGASNIAIAASSSKTIFSYPHGALEIGNAIVLGTVKESPGHLIMFPDPADLSRYVATTTEGYRDLADGDYDAVHDRIYYYATRIDDGRLSLLSFDPATLAWKSVFEFPIADTGYATIQTDNTYVYIATQSVPAYLMKIRISDWSLAALRSFPSIAGFHSSAFYRYPDRAEWYVTTFSIPTLLFKINPADLSYVTAPLPESGDATNDCYFRPINAKGGKLYVTSEAQFGMNVVDTATMTATHYATPGSYGLFSDGTDLYSADARDSVIIKYPKFNIQDPVSFEAGAGHHPNEILFSSGKSYFTDFDSPSALYEFSMTH